MYKIVLAGNNETNKKNLTDWIGLLVNMGRVIFVVRIFKNVP